MSRLVLFVVAAGAVVLAQFIDRGSQQIVNLNDLARQDRPIGADDNVLTGSIRRPPQR
jgi:hypothetical protein